MMAGSACAVWAAAAVHMHDDNATVPCACSNAPHQALLRSLGSGSPEARSNWTVVIEFGGDPQAAFVIFAIGRPESDAGLPVSGVMTIWAHSSSCRTRSSGIRVMWGCGKEWFPIQTGRPRPACGFPPDGPAFHFPPRNSVAGVRVRPKPGSVRHHTRSGFGGTGIERERDTFRAAITVENHLCFSGEAGGGMLNSKGEFEYRSMPGFICSMRNSSCPANRHR